MSIVFNKSEQKDCLLDATDDQVNKTYKVYKYRFVVSFLYGLVTLVNAIQWICTSPIVTNLQHVYDLSIFTVTFCTSLIWFVIYVPMNFPANYVLDEYGLFPGVFTGAFLTVSGLWIRTFSNYSFYYIFAGQVLGAIGQPFLLNAPQKLSSVWYPPDERAISTTVASIANPIGVGIGFVIAQAFVENGASGETGRAQIQSLMLFTAELGTGLIVPALVFFKNKPKTPPSKAADTQKHGYMDSLKHLFKNANYLIFIVSIGLFWGSYNIIATVLQPMLNPFGYSESESGNLGGITLVTGLIGSVVWGLYLDKTKKFKSSIIICSILSLIGLASIALLSPLKNYLYLCLATCIYGFFTTPLFPIAFEFCAELSFPVAEAAASGLMVCMTQIFAVVGTIGVDILLDTNTVNNSLISFGIIGGVAVLGLIGFLITKEELKREKHEKEEENTKSLVNSESQYQNDISSNI